MKNLAEEIMSKNDELEKIKSELDKIKEKMGEKDEELRKKQDVLKISIILTLLRFMSFSRKTGLLTT